MSENDAPKEDVVASIREALKPIWKDLTKENQQIIVDQMEAVKAILADMATLQSKMDDIAVTEAVGPPGTEAPGSHSFTLVDTTTHAYHQFTIRSSDPDIAAERGIALARAKVASGEFVSRAIYEGQSVSTPAGPRAAAGQPAPEAMAPGLGTANVKELKAMTNDKNEFVWKIETMGPYQGIKPTKYPVPFYEEAIAETQEAGLLAEIDFGQFVGGDGKPYTFDLRDQKLIAHLNPNDKGYPNKVVGITPA